MNWKVLALGFIVMTAMSLYSMNAEPNMAEEAREESLQD